MNNITINFACANYYLIIEFGDRPWLNYPPTQLKHDAISIGLPDLSCG